MVMILPTMMRAAGLTELDSGSLGRGRCDFPLRGRHGESTCLGYGNEMAKVSLMLIASVIRKSWAKSMRASAVMIISPAIVGGWQSQLICVKTWTVRTRTEAIKVTPASASANSASKVLRTDFLDVE